MGAVSRMRQGTTCFPSRLLAVFTGWMIVLTLLTGATQAADRPLRIVAFGDSLTAGYGLSAGAAFPVVLENALRGRGHAVTLVNAGVSGDTSTGGLDRLDWSVPEGTDGVILELGANDMFRGTDPAVTRRALETIITRLKERGIPVLLAGMYASRNMGAYYVARFEAVYKDLAAKYDLVFYPFFLDGIAQDKRYNLADGVHPNEAGVRTVVERILPSVETFLSRLRRST